MSRLATIADEHDGYDNTSASGAGMVCLHARYTKRRNSWPVDAETPT